MSGRHVPAPRCPVHASSSLSIGRPHPPHLEAEQLGAQAVEVGGEGSHGREGAGAGGGHDGNGAHGVGVHIRVGAADLLWGGGFGWRYGRAVCLLRGPISKCGARDRDIMRGTRLPVSTARTCPAGLLDSTQQTHTNTHARTWVAGSPSHATTRRPPSRVHATESGMAQPGRTVSPTLTPGGIGLMVSG